MHVAQLRFSDGCSSGAVRVFLAMPGLLYPLSTFRLKENLHVQFSAAGIGFLSSF